MCDSCVSIFNWGLLVPPSLTTLLESGRCEASFYFIDMGWGPALTGSKAHFRVMEPQRGVKLEVPCLGGGVSPIKQAVTMVRSRQ